MDDLSGFEFHSQSARNDPGGLIERHFVCFRRLKRLLAQSK
jgi:hypothetical protein